MTNLAHFRADVRTAWDHAIEALDRALSDALTARRAIEGYARTLEGIEASAVLTVEGGNAETRKAKLSLALADDPRYQETSEKLSQARFRLADAERQATICKERTRLFRSLVAPAE